jgi:hypothetical protein
MPSQVELCAHHAKGLSPSRRENRRSLGARDASQACAGVDAGRACSIQAIEALCRLWTQGSTGIEPGTLSHLRSSAPSATLVCPVRPGGLFLHIAATARAASQAAPMR